MLARKGEFAIIGNTNSPHGPLPVLVRRTADPDGKYVTLSRDEWQVFVAGMKDGISTASE
jgi:hypothetical protein